MGLLGFLTSSVGGILLGELGKWGTTFLENWRANQESKRRLEEIKVLSATKIDEAQWAAFHESVKQQESSFVLPQNASNKMQWVMLCVDVIIRLVRVVLLMGGTLFLAHIWNTCALQDKATLTQDLTTYFMCIGYWWIGERYQKRNLQK